MKELEQMKPCDISHSNIEQRKSYSSQLNHGLEDLFLLFEALWAPETITKNCVSLKLLCINLIWNKF